ncbi:hypothetical protein JHN47_46300, partial [Streptomyces sp. MBT62]|nr:hypothetical protein [Streptomyces sp. MBT62]
GVSGGGAEGRFTVTTDSSADLAARAAAEPARGAGAWTLLLNAVNHGPATVYGTADKSVAVVDVVLPPHTVATGYAHAESEDSLHGPCFLPVGDTGTAPFKAGRRHYVCTVPTGIAAGRSQEFALWVKADKDYAGAKGTATVRPGRAGLPLHDPNASNNSVTFTFGAPADSGGSRTPLAARHGRGHGLGECLPHSPEDHEPVREKRVLTGSPRGLGQRRQQVFLDPVALRVEIRIHDHETHRRALLLLLHTDHSASRLGQWA